MRDAITVSLLPVYTTQLAIKILPACTFSPPVAKIKKKRSCPKPRPFNFIPIDGRIREGRTVVSPNSSSMLSNPCIMKLLKALEQPFPNWFILNGLLLSEFALHSTFFFSYWHQGFRENCHGAAPNISQCLLINTISRIRYVTCWAVRGSLWQSIVEEKQMAF